ncbi:hypothetical protein WICPIJ_007684 [Wickerhamomyces pijperi]|uniref:Xylanolytic transcriptional activator regulatory domain-containing protein n=1 Tax=Wickerhamomyces pijperi TaxID=599730 RepID=A0A9P8TJN7_WICPI|nr:hypothetical protein WICPIJ_007684 [Wickerhamomyces pijperi]
MSNTNPFEKITLPSLIQPPQQQQHPSYPLHQSHQAQVIQSLPQFVPQITCSSCQSNLQHSSKGFIPCSNCLQRRINSSSGNGGIAGDYRVRKNSAPSSSNREDIRNVSPGLSNETLMEQNLQLQRQVALLQSQLNSSTSTSPGSSDSQPQPAFSKATPTFSDLFSITSSQLSAFVSECIVKTLPPQKVVEALVLVFFSNNLNQKHLIHVPTFQTQQSAFWSLINAKDFSKVDPLWITLLYLVLASSITSLSPAVINESPILKDYFNHSEPLDAQHTLFFQTSRRIGATYLMTDSLNRTHRLIRLQILCLGMNYLCSICDFNLIDTEILPQAIAVALSMNLDSPSSLRNPSLTVLEIEIRKRVWWDVCTWDTSRAFANGRRSILMLCYSKVPMPLNCNDVDLDFYHCFEQSLDVWCDSSHSISRFRVMKVLGGVFSLRVNDQVNGIVIAEWFNKIHEIDNAMFEIYHANAMKYQSNPLFHTSVNAKTPQLHIDDVLIKYHSHRAQLYIAFLPFDMSAQKICLTSMYQVLMRFLNLATLYPNPDMMRSTWINVNELVMKTLTMRVLVCSDVHFFNQTVKEDYQRGVQIITSYLKSSTAVNKELGNFFEALKIIKERVSEIPVDMGVRKIRVDSLITGQDQYSEIFGHVEKKTGIDLGFRLSDNELESITKTLKKLGKSKRGVKKFWEKVNKFEGFKGRLRSELEVLSYGYLSFIRRESGVLF